MIDAGVGARTTTFSARGCAARNDGAHRVSVRSRRCVRRRRRCVDARHARRDRLRHPDATPGSPDATPGTADATPGTPDATPAVPDATPVVSDAVPVCPAACTSCAGGVCRIDCGPGGCSSGVTCPPGMPCEVNCIGHRRVRVRTRRLHCRVRVRHQLPRHRRLRQRRAMRRRVMHGRVRRRQRVRRRARELRRPRLRYDVLGLQRLRGRRLLRWRDMLDVRCFRRRLLRLSVAAALTRRAVG